MLELKVAKGIYGIKQNDWFICKIDNKWYFLSREEYKKFEYDLGLFPKKHMTRAFRTKKELIQFYSSQVMYKHLFID